MVVTLFSILGSGLPAPAQVRLDHVPIAVRQLDTAIETFRGLGFSIKPGSKHPNSIRDAHIKFRDGTALELITASRKDDRTASFYLRFLQAGEGPAALSLDGGTIDSLKPKIQRLGLDFETFTGPFYEWLLFGGPLAYLFFGTISSRPPDLPDHLSHRNTALSLGSVWIAKESFEKEDRLFSILGARRREADFSLPVPGRIREFALRRGELYGVTTSAADIQRPIVGITVLVTDIVAADTILGSRIRSRVLHGEDTRGRYVRVPPELAYGTWIEFLQEALHNGREGRKW
jgi:hypothetical protein